MVTDKVVRTSTRDEEFQANIRVDYLMATDLKVMVTGKGKMAKSKMTLRCKKGM